MNPIRLMLVDDHDVVRTGLKAFLDTQEGLQVVAEAASGLQALDLVLQSHPDVVVMDITMPQMDGLEATRRLKALSPDLPGPGAYCPTKISSTSLRCCWLGQAGM